MKVIIGLGSCGIASGGLKVKEAFETLVAAHPEAAVELAETGCMGMCYKEVNVENRGGGRTQHDLRRG